MRQLSKIVFINSANIRYGEVQLDGNVHLIGTQGVGKSTVLRAILFFYTAEKNKLGISREKRTFDDFYLPGANSYLIYEVESEFGAFTVLVFRRNAHSVFRFINASFRKEWLIDENGEVTADPSVIRRRLGSAQMTRIVDEYQEYRDIIYGNRRVAGKEFARYSIMETAKYQNIPRSLQNVFLGAKVDADFIKDIVIRSLGDEEPGIDLVYFRSQLAGFEREYNDIQAWFQKNKQGEVTVRRQAEKVIEHYRRLLYLDDELVSSLLELRFARHYAEEHIPLLEKQAEEKEIDLNKHREKLSELQDKYSRELSSLEQEYGVLKDKLDRIPDLKKKYQQLKIQELIEEDGREPALKVQLESARALKERLTREYADISSKYAILEREQRLGFDSWKAAMEGRKVEIGGAYNEKMQKAAEILRIELDAIENGFREREESVRGLIEDLSRRVWEADKQMALSALLSPYAAEIEAARSELSRLSGEDRALKASEKEMQVRIETATKEAQMQQGNLAREYDDKLETVRSRIEELSSQIAGIEELLSSMDGSLIQWLNHNKPDWAENIGKVTDERTVLYAKNLWPKEGKGDSLFGVDIDLSGLKTRVRTPVQLREEKQRLEKERLKHQNEQEGLIAQKESELSALKKKHNAHIKDLKDQLAQLQTAALMLPAKIEGVKKQVSSYEQKTQEERAAARAHYKGQLEELHAQRVLASEQLKKLVAEKSTEIQRADQADARRRKSLKEQHDAAIAAVAKEMEEKEAALLESLVELSRERSRELAGQGADTKALAQCEKEIQDLTARLERIGANKETLFNYRKDKEEYFDKRDIYLSQKKTIEEKKTSLSERYKLRKKKEEDALEHLNEALIATKDQLKTLKDGLQEADNFRENNTLPLLPDGREQKTGKTCRQLIDLIHGVLSEKRSTEQTFSQSVNSFTGHFSPGNIFGFRTDNRTDEDYRNFAASLVEFMESDKIEEYRRRTSGHYTDLLLRLSHEMDEVSRNSSEIAGIIKDINFDFREKNFIGAVKSIELRTVASADRMVILLSQIKEFVDEHSFELEGVNLFSGNARDQVNTEAVRHLLSLMNLLVGEHAGRNRLTLSDTFQLEFRITENDNDTGWVEKISSVGSDGTDVLVKAMVNIMLINVFKERVSGRFADFRIHCVMDEIGKLHPRNVKGILDFAGARNIFLVNGSPVPYNVADYKHTYLLTKDGNHTVIQSLLSRKEAAQV